MPALPLRDPRHLARRAVPRVRRADLADARRTGRPVRGVHRSCDLCADGATVAAGRRRRDRRKRAGRGVAGGLAMDDSGRLVGLGSGPWGRVFGMGSGGDGPLGPDRNRLRRRGRRSAGWRRHGDDRFAVATNESAASTPSHPVVGGERALPRDRGRDGWMDSHPEYLGTDRLCGDRRAASCRRPALGAARSRQSALARRRVGPAEPLVGGGKPRDGRWPVGGSPGCRWGGSDRCRDAGGPAHRRLDAAGGGRGALPRGESALDRGGPSSEEASPRAAAGRG